MKASPPPALALLCAVAAESAALRDRILHARELRIGRRAAVEGVLEGVPVLLLCTGMGKTNAAQAVTAVLETRTVTGVIGFGIAGAFMDTGLDPGDLVLASGSVYADEGVDAADGFLSTREMGIPLLDGPGSPSYNEFAPPPEWLHRARLALEAGGERPRTGVALTLSTCSGTRARGDALRKRFDALCEAMEGAALAHVCAHYGVPFLELRAISNAVEDRDLSRWRTAEAAAAVQRAISIVVPALLPSTRESRWS